MKTSSDDLYILKLFTSICSVECNGHDYKKMKVSEISLTNLLLQNSNSWPMICESKTLFYVILTQESK